MFDLRTLLNQWEKGYGLDLSSFSEGPVVYWRLWGVSVGVVPQEDDEDDEDEDDEEEEGDDYGNHGWSNIQQFINYYYTSFLERRSCTYKLVKQNVLVDFNKSTS